MCNSQKHEAALRRVRDLEMEMAGLEELRIADGGRDRREDEARELRLADLARERDENQCIVEQIEDLWHDEYEMSLAEEESDLALVRAERAAERGPNCDDWGPPSDHSDEGFDCCRNQGSPFCAHGGPVEAGW